MPAAFQILSDIHLETRGSYEFPFPQTAPNLALLGDIGQVVDPGFFPFLEKQLQRYWNVFFLLGNHEPALTSWAESKRQLRLFADRMERLRARSTIGRFVFLDQTRYNLDDTITILGCTLFSGVTIEQRDAVGTRFVDFRQIQNWHVDDHVAAHAADVAWLNRQVAATAAAEPQRQIVVLTHHCPTVDRRTVDPRFHGVVSLVSSGFATDLSQALCWTSPSVVQWVFGHTHVNCDYVDESTGKKVAANQLGYLASPTATFDAKKVFLVGRESTAPGGVRSMLE